MESQELYLAMFEEATIGILVVNADGEIQNANPFLEKLFGYNNGELQNQNLEMLIPETFRKSHIQHQKNYHSHPTPRTMGSNLELYGLKKDGSQFPVEVSLSFSKIKNESLAIAYVNDISTRKNTLIELEKSKDQLDEAQTLGQVGSFDWDLQTGKINTSKQLLRLFGTKPQSSELTADFFLKYVHPDDLEKVKHRITQIHEGKPINNLEYRIIMTDGSIRNIRSVHQIELDKNNKAIRFLGLLQDLTEQKKAESYTTAILSSISSNIAVLNQEGVIINVNQAWEDFAKNNSNGHLKSTGNGVNYLNICSQSYQNGDKTANLAYEGIKTVLDGEQKEFYLEYPCDSPTEKRWFSMTVNPLLHINKGAVVVHTNITAQKKAEEKLKESLSRFEILTELAPIGIFLTDEKGNCLFVNKKWQELSGISMKDAMGDGWTKFIYSEDKETAFGKWNDAIQKGAMFEDEYRCINYQTKKISDVWDIAAPLFDENGKVTNYIGVVQDITELKKAKRNLQQINLELEEKVKERTLRLEEKRMKLNKALEKEKELGELKSRFVSMASHEFRTPLTSILSSTNLIGNYDKTEQQDKRMRHVNRIASSVKNLTFILNDFLSLEKLESGKVNYNPNLIDFEEYVESFMDEIRLLAKGKQEIIFRHTGKKEVRIDDNLVKNVLINLLSNAVKYSPEGEDVELISKNVNGLLEISVIDKGIGIPEADHEHMFTRFFRANNVENIQGTGLGLTIVKRYLDLMDGEIDFESEENVGTTFRVKIPQ